MAGYNTAARLEIHILEKDAVVGFAAQELCDYLQKITNICPEMVWETDYQSDLVGIWLGPARAFPQLPFSPLVSELDDEIYIQVEKGQGIIAGINGRSVLLAIYRFLSEAGCRWLRPGTDGEYIPSRKLAELNVSLNERPSYRHRAICIEGAVSLENILDIIAWAPKVGLSGYFMQFREGYTFFDRWYAHTENPTKPPVKISVDQARDFTAQIEVALEKRGMLYHAVGHGWTCEAFGIPGLGWDPVIQEWPEEVINSLALVNGRRAMWNDIPLITSLCFSNAEVRKKVVDCIVQYVQVHSNIQALHFWLDDGFNNKCECAECEKMRPSDYYVMLLNELDEALTQIGYPGKIVFLSYADLLWPPEHGRLHHPERFVMMFAPITRSYRRPLFPQNLDYPLPPFVRNHLVFSNNNDEQLAFLRAWQTLFTGDSFIFDYHLWRPGTYTCDPDALFLARLLSTDIKNLKQLGLNGLVSCQLQRIFFPTGLAMYVMGRTLWDDTLLFDDLLDDYFSASFGPDWQLSKRYLLSLSEMQDIVPILEKDLSVDPQAAARLEQGLLVIQQFAPVIERNLHLPERSQALSWFYLKIHAELMQRFLYMLSARSSGKKAEAVQYWNGIKTFVREKEGDIQPVFDVYAFISTFEREFSEEQG
jgi:hypothetical protein